MPPAAHTVTSPSSRSRRRISLSSVSVTPRHNSITAWQTRRDKGRHSNEASKAAPIPTRVTGLSQAQACEGPWVKADDSPAASVAPPKNKGRNATRRHQTRMSPKAIIRGANKLSAMQKACVSRLRGRACSERAGSQTTAAQLRTAINNHAEAGQLVVASLRSSAAGSVNITAPDITYSPIVLGGANAASVVSNLNVGGNFQVKITAAVSGPSGNGIEVIINRVDFGGVHPPDVLVSGRTITVNVNSSAASPTTAQEFVNAINLHPQASALVDAAVTIGSPDTVIGNRVSSGTRLRLTGTSDA